MAPHLPVRQLLTWSLPSVAILLSYLWYKKRRIGAPSDSGGGSEEQKVNNTVSEQTLNEEEEEEESRITTTPQKLSRSLSGVETTPINIVYPQKQLKHSKSHSPPAVISDEDLDLEIEKIKSMRTQYNISPSTISTKTPSPVKSQKSTGSSASSPDSVIRKESFEHSPIKKNICSTPITSPTVAAVPTTPIASPTTPVTTPKKNRAVNKGKIDQPIMLQEGEVVEEKVIKMTEEKENLSSPKTNNEKEETQVINQIRRRNSSGRDSANHSPCDLLATASPSLSFMSDNHSERSSDSGKGGSDAATPPPALQPDNVPTNYEFVIPQSLVGKLIGRQGVFVLRIKEKCNAEVYVSDHPTNKKLKLCSIEGTHAEIDKALKMIRDKFPLKKYSEVSLEKVELAPVVRTVSLIPDHLYLKLVEGINNDTILSCMVAPDHLFMQQPTHPAFPSLAMLSNCMNHCYGQPDSPLLPTPIPENTVCVAYSEGAWYRAVVLSSDLETDSSYIKFLDYGGYCYVENDKLRQIRQDFMLLPFQAAECFLANVKPKTEDGTWPQEAYDLVANTTKGSVIYTQIADYTPDGVPLVLCYVVRNSQTVIFINQKLVDEGYADWVDFDATVAAS